MYSHNPGLEGGTFLMSVPAMVSDFPSGQCHLDGTSGWSLALRAVGVLSNGVSAYSLRTSLWKYCMFNT